MRKLIMTWGLPASGKTTWAKEQVANGNGQVKRINKDDLRSMIDNSIWSKPNEGLILTARDKLIEMFLTYGSGHTVIVDDTNLMPKHEKKLRQIAEACGAEFEIKMFMTPLAECIRRDMLRPEGVGKKVIRRMYEGIRELYEPKLVYNPALPECIIVDIDGTLAHMAGRSPYDYTKVSTDTVDEVVADIVRRYRSADPMEENPCYVIIVSGREDTCKAETLQWLQDNHIPFDEIHMRNPEAVDESGKQLDDRIIKKGIYDEWIKNRYNVRFVLDDRNRVVDMWRSLGLKVLQVGEGDF